MERFVIRQKYCEHYRAMLKIVTDLERRSVIERLVSKRKPNSKNTTKMTRRNNGPEGSQIEIRTPTSAN